MGGREGEEGQLQDKAQACQEVVNKAKYCESTGLSESDSFFCDRGMNLGGQREASYTGQPDTKCLLSSKKNLRGKVNFLLIPPHNLQLDSSGSY